MQADETHADVSPIRRSGGSIALVSPDPAGDPASSVSVPCSRGCNPALAAEYEALKLRPAQQHPNDRAAYTNGKRALVARVLASVGDTLGRR